MTLGVISEVESVRPSSVGGQLGVRETTVMRDLRQCADVVPSKFGSDKGEQVWARRVRGWDWTSMSRELWNIRGAAPLKPSERQRDWNLQAETGRRQRPEPQTQGQEKFLEIVRCGGPRQKTLETPELKGQVVKTQTLWRGTVQMEASGSLKKGAEVRSTRCYRKV